MLTDEDVYIIEPSYDTTVAVEVSKTGLLRRRKHILTFERFKGRLNYSPDSPTASQVSFSIETGSVVCRDKWLKSGKQQHVAEYTRSKVLAADRYPNIEFVSESVSLKHFRGFVIEGVLTIRGVQRPAKLNAVLGPLSGGRFQIDADAPIRLSDFEIEPPSSLLGLIGTADGVVLHVLVWAAAAAQRVQGQ